MQYLNSAQVVLFVVMVECCLLELARSWMTTKYISGRV